MAYEESKDKLIKLFELKQEKSSLLCSIFSYDGGELKIGLTRSYEKKDGTMGASLRARVGSIEFCGSGRQRGEGDSSPIQDSSNNVMEDEIPF